jgi:BirA family transcriptional regulator, biotin operon repressor / biotin---[acetyl-CoA-carboxylase] ligase
MSLDEAGQEARFPTLRIRRVARTRSTQDIVLHAARSGAAEGFCSLADEQTAGRGRQGRSWSAPPGSSLLVSVLLRRPAAVAAGIPFAAGLAIVDALAATSGVTAGLKWPNDVLVGRRKLAGILSEVAPGSSPAGEVAVALGLGVNLTVDSFPAGADAVSLHTLVADPPHAEVLLRAWSTALAPHLAALERSGVPAIAAAWRANAVGLGEPVTVHTPSGSFEGIAMDIADDGALLVQSDGEVRRVLAGDVHLGRQAGR